MFSPEPRPLPFRTIFAEQFRVTGFALVREAMLAAAALTAVCVIALLTAWRYDARLYLDRELLMPTVVLAALLPFAVWKGDRPFDRALLWTLPVPRQRAALAKLSAGAVWMMIALLITCAALALVALASGGGIGMTRSVMVEGVGGAIVRQDWRAPAWMWLIPFVGALTLYVMGSAAVLGMRHPLRWISGVGVGIGVMIAIITSLASESAFESFIENWVIRGDVGIDFALNAGEYTLSYWRRGAEGRFVQIWRELPDIGGWAVAASFWMGLALTMLGLAFRGHWER